MKKLFIILAVLLIGCTTDIHIPLDGTPLSATEATVIVWLDQKPLLINEDVPLMLDGTEMGRVKAKKPLKFTANPGKHKIYGSLPLLIIDRALDVEFKAGEVYYYRLWGKAGWWVSSIYITPAEKAPFYDSVIHKLRDE
jgi:hypothetical protein